MNIRTVMGSLLFLYAISGYTADDKENISALESEIYKAAESNGLDSSNLNIIWNSASSGGYTASIRCNSSDKCNKSEISVSFSQRDMETTNGSQLRTQLLRAKIKSLLNNKPR